MKSLSVFFLIIYFFIYPVSSETISIKFKSNRITVKPVCKEMYSAVEKGDINVVKNLVGKLETREAKLACIKYSLKQKRATEEKGQFQAFKYLVELLISMRLPEQKTILNKILRDYTIVYLSNSPEFTRYLLSLGALPKTPNEFGEFPITSALWTPHDRGDCETPRLLINASSPEVLALQNKEGETALMQSVGERTTCFDEYKLLAEKTPNLNVSDNEGNTVLHHLLFEIKEYFSHGLDTPELSLDVLSILLKRGASMEVSNKKNVKPYQLLQELQDKGCKCYIHE